MIFEGWSFENIDHCQTGLPNTQHEFVVILFYEFVWCEAYESLRFLEKSKHENPPLNINRGRSRLYKNLQISLYEFIRISQQFAKT